MMFKQFARDERGSVLPIFALSIIPMFGLMGAAIDYSRASATRADMQSAVDALGIMLAKEANKLTPAEITSKANAYFHALFNRPEARSIVITPVFEQTDGSFKIKVTGAGEVPTRFMNILGFNKMDITTSTEVVWGTRKLELALALDNTGSMASSGKMDELKKATKSLLDTLKKSALKPDSVKVSIIPFATDVNVGAGTYANATWLDWTAFDADSLPKPDGSGNYLCFGQYCWDDVSNPPKIVLKRSLWNGCVWDRQQPHDASDVAPTTTAQKFQPHQAANCPASLMPLTNDWTALNAKVDAMVPTGNTNVSIGLAWGWHAVTTGEPLTQGTAPAKDLDKVIILLTDGDNTQNRWTGSQGDIDARTTATCNAVKAAGVKVYTVRVINGNATLLRNCATESTMYYDVQNSSQLLSVFQKIGENLATLRIAK
jgi:hypothetical protein